MKKVMIYMIRWYQKHISCWLEAKNIHCKYYPSCSEYTKQAITEHGSIKGLVLGIKRILRCRPMGKHGIDLVPLKEKR